MEKELTYTLFTLMMVVFTFYVSIVWIKFGIHKSISDSFYSLSKKYNFLFTFFCWGFAIPTIILGAEISSLMFVAGLAICFVGAANSFNGDDLTRVVHVIGAYSGVFLSQCALFFDYKLWGINIIFIASSTILVLLKVSNKIWWIEILAFLSISYALLLNL